MKSIQGIWYDGKTSNHVPAVLEVTDSGRCRVLRTDAKALLVDVPRDDVFVPSRIGRTPRFLSFPGGGKFETTDHDAVDTFLTNRQSNRYRRLIYTLESKKSWFITAAIIVVIVVFGLVRYGIPVASKWVAFLLPSSVGDIASEQTLKMLDKSLFSPSGLDTNRREEVLQGFSQVLAAYPNLSINVEFRKGGPIGANAFALPSGKIIFTDEMVQLATHQDELSAVLAHEIGHVVHRHGLRMLIQDSLLAFIAVLITGDASGVAEIFLSLPIVLTERAYARGFEEEADQYTQLYLKKENIPLCRFSSLLVRIEEERYSKISERSQKAKKDVSKEAAPEWLDYLSTHPNTSKRVEKFNSTGCED